MIIGEEEMKNERQLLTVEDGPLMQGRGISAIPHPPL